MAYLSQRDGITLDDAYALTATHVPLRRVAEPEEIVSCCAFLASGDASMVTGHVLVADGGGATVDASSPPAGRVTGRGGDRVVGIDVGGTFTDVVGRDRETGDTRAF